MKEQNNETSNNIHIHIEDPIACFVTVTVKSNSTRVATYHTWYVCRICFSSQYYSETNRLKEQDIIQGTDKRPLVQLGIIYYAIRGFAVCEEELQKKKIAYIKSIYSIERSKYDVRN